MNRSAAVLLSMFCGAGLFCACASDETKSVRAPLVDCAGYDKLVVQTAEVSFAKDVMPIIQHRCNDAVSCHGTDPNNGVVAGSLYLGPTANQTANPQLTSYVLNSWLKADDQSSPPVSPAGLRSSQASPSTHLVEPGKPGKSMLVLKVDGCQNSVGLTDCNVPKVGGCGDAMPNSGHAQEALTAAEATAFRQWVAQGAKDN